jgi:hypothetical protein
MRLDMKFSERPRANLSVCLFGSLSESSARSSSYDHCNMTAGPEVDGVLVEQLTKLLLAMSYADEEVRPLLDLEGLTQWLPGRADRYALLERAVDELGFYDREGRPIAANPESNANHDWWEEPTPMCIVAASYAPSQGRC